MSRLHLVSLLALITACASDGSASEHVTEQRAYGRYAGTFQNRADCDTAKQAGQFPSLAACQDQIILCPDGRAETLIGGDVIERPTYTFADDQLTMMFSAEGRLTGIVAADGTLVTDDRDRPWDSIVVVDGIGWELSQCSAEWGP